jgi:hypothetical protein
VELLVACGQRLTDAELALVERFVRTAGTWAYVDDPAERVAGEAGRRTVDLTARDGHAPPLTNGFHCS